MLVFRPFAYTKYISIQIAGKDPDRLYWFQTGKRKRKELDTKHDRTGSISNSGPLPRNG